MKYLVIGDANSMHIFNFVKTVLLPREYEVHLLTLSNMQVRESYRSFYSENGIFLHSIAEKGYSGLDKNDRVHRLLNLWRKLRLMKDIPKVDVCHVQSVYKTSMIMLLKNKKKYDRLILSYWGGDIEDRNESVVELRRKCFEFADAITVTVMQTYNEFREIYGNKYDDKLYVSRFATAGIDCIKSFEGKVSRRECRESYGIPEGKICITCGYSAYREQHQDRCIEEIAKLPEDIRKKLFVIVPMQYGKLDDTEYFERVEAAKAKADFDCVILKEFVPFEMSARLAVATDIYLHLRDTDAFSNALKEHVYGGSHIITGSWLKYIELEEMNAPMTVIDSFDELNETLLEILKDFEIKKELELFSPIYELYATEKIAEQWGRVVDIAIK